jgi:hypothetical protein
VQLTLAVWSTNVISRLETYTKKKNLFKHVFNVADVVVKLLLLYNIRQHSSKEESGISEDRESMYLKQPCQHSPCEESRVAYQQNLRLLTKTRDFRTVQSV